MAPRAGAGVARATASRAWIGCVHYISSFTRARDARATSRATHDVARADAEDLIASATDGNRRR
jgi:hypothetical protein